MAAAVVDPIINLLKWQNFVCNKIGFEPVSVNNSFSVVVFLTEPTLVEYFKVLNC